MKVPSLCAHLGLPKYSVCMFDFLLLRCLGVLGYRTNMWLLSLVCVFVVLSMNV